MAAGILTRAQVVSNGLEMGGNTGIETLANTFLNLFLDSLARAHDFETLVKLTSIAGIAGGINLAAHPDYRAIKQIQLVGDSSPLIQTDFATIVSRRTPDIENGVTGDATHFAAFTAEGGASSSLYLWPIPSSAVTANILYYSVPAEITSDDTVPWYEDSTTLVNAVADFAAMYDRDTMQAIVARNVDVALGRAMSGMTDQGRANAQQLKFDSSVYRVWRGDS